MRQALWLYIQPDMELETKTIPEASAELVAAAAALYEELDTTQSTNLKVAAMARYFRTAPPADAA